MSCEGRTHLSAIKMGCASGVSPTFSNSFSFFSSRVNQEQTQVVSISSDCGCKAYSGMSMKPSSSTQKSAFSNSSQTLVFPHPWQPSTHMTIIFLAFRVFHLFLLTCKAFFLCSDLFYPLPFLLFSSPSPFSAETMPMSSSPAV